MREYASITLNMIEYASIQLKKQSFEYAIVIVNVSDLVHSTKSPYDFRDRGIQNTVKTFKMERFAKK